MEQLVDAMKKVLADTFALYLKAHYFHWNVTGPNFPQYHEFFQNIYTEVYGAVDPIAEEIRALNGYAPGSFERYKQLASIKDQTDIPAANEMIRILMMDNMTVQQTLMDAYKLADQYNEIGLSNFLQDRYDAHKKHGWMLRATLGQ